LQKSARHVREHVRAWPINTQPVKEETMSTRSISKPPAPPQEADPTIQTIDALAELGVTLSRIQRRRKQLPAAVRPDVAKANMIARSLWKRMQDGTLIGKRVPTLAPSAAPEPRIKDVGGEIERVAGFLRGIEFCLNDLGDRGPDVRPGDMTDKEWDEEERYSWLWRVLLEAMERECDKLQALAVAVYQLSHDAPKAVAS
jgi:hypothetical protein